MANLMGVAVRHRVFRKARKEDTCFWIYLSRLLHKQPCSLLFMDADAERPGGRCRAAGVNTHATSKHPGFFSPYSPCITRHSATHTQTHTALHYYVIWASGHVSSKHILQLPRLSENCGNSCGLQGRKNFKQMNDKKSSRTRRHNTGLKEEAEGSFINSRY